jgi:ATP-dependent Lon protease
MKGGVSQFLSALRGKTGGLALNILGDGNAVAPAESFPLLPLKELVLFPNTVTPLFITQKPGVLAVETALRQELRLFAASTKSKDDNSTSPVGAVVRIIQHVRLPDGGFRIVLQGEYRGIVVNAEEDKEHVRVWVKPFKSVKSGEPLDSETEALMRAVQKSFAQYAELSKKISTETISAVERSENPERLCNLVCNSLAVRAEKKLALIGIEDPQDRLVAVLECLEAENEIFGIQRNISGKVKSRMERNQREYFLNEQLREINKELGKEDVVDEFEEVEKALLAKNPGEEVLEKARKEIKRIRKLQPFSPEAGVLRTYLEWLAELPWSEYSPDSVELFDAEKILDEDHFGMKKAKERILEFIAVRQLSGGSNEKAAIRGPILCFVGPPGTGKTSLGKSVARSLGRRFVRISLGGVRDEAEIRGHRKTYVGALPGKIIQSMRKARTMNPVFLLDEIDKLSSDFRGDPASALLEVLDPEQNSSFTDHYLELAYDLSKVLFITTANSLHGIPYPLLDRMEIIEIPGYGENEKLSIAKQFLFPKELEENGLNDAKIGIKDDALLEIIRHWTMESGVRSLEREIARCIRRIARDAVKKGYRMEGPVPHNEGEALPKAAAQEGKPSKGQSKPICSFKKIISKGDLEKLLGRRKYKNDVVFKEARIGVTYGLAWTETGGAILPVETSRFPGGGDLIITGNLGDVMKESARIALSYLRSVQDTYHFKFKDIGKSDFHIHVPEGAIPKDGPSAGITLAASLLSTLCRKAPLPGVAMTGELTLTGKILPIGGLKEKLLAAIRNGIERVLLPLENREDWEELDKDIRNALRADFVERAGDAFGILFEPGILKTPQKPRKARNPRRRSPE